jgi:hypothetical protein
LLPLFEVVVLTNTYIISLNVTGIVVLYLFNNKNPGIQDLLQKEKLSSSI